jgi:protein phosphatase
VKISGAGISDVGRKRRTNEDFFHIDPEKGLFIVADGMGGHAAGEVASRLAVDTIQEFLRISDPASEITWPEEIDESMRAGGNRIRAAIQLANRAIVRAMQSHTEQRGMGTTVVTAAVVDGKCLIGHVGDSRAYLIRDGEITQLTRDHTFVNDQVEKGFLSRAEAQRHPARNILTRAVGSADELDVDVNEMDLRTGDILLLCSDGLSTMVEDDAILRTVLQHADDLPAGCRALVDQANENGGLDNVTVVLIRAV